MQQPHKALKFCGQIYFMCEQQSKCVYTLGLVYFYHAMETCTLREGTNNIRYYIIELLLSGSGTTMLLSDSIDKGALMPPT